MYKISRQKLYDAICYIQQKYQRKNFEYLKFYVSYNETKGLRFICVDITRFSSYSMNHMLDITWCFKQRMSIYDITEIAAIEIERWYLQKNHAQVQLSYSIMC